MAGSERNRNGASLREAEKRKLFEAGGVDHRFEIIDPRV